MSQASRDAERAERAERARVAAMSDDDVLARAGHLGPGIIGHALHDRAAEIRKRTSGGKLGPAIVGAAPPAPAERQMDEYEGFTRAQLLKAARDAELDVESKATKDELVDALIAANIAPPPIEDDEDED